MLALLSPMVAAVPGAVVLGQVFGPIQLAGIALALAAIVAGHVTPPAAEAKVSR